MNVMARPFFNVVSYRIKANEPGGIKASGPPTISVEPRELNTGREVGPDFLERLKKNEAGAETGAGAPPARDPDMPLVLTPDTGGNETGN